MVVKFLDPARDEMAEAIAYYDARKAGLGAAFSGEIKKTIERILRHPEAWFKLSERTRRCRVNRFPYGIIYQLRGEVLLIVAVMHLHREPKTWTRRLIDE